MNEDNHPPLEARSFAERLKEALPVAFKQDEAFRYALILGILALLIAVHGHHAKSVIQ
ncbi:hypothetical protein AA23498_2651 [Acetobacter nitrogenifigens DSM 23921 = NBRC 105050]|uniref:Uncharacterized protein n=1 Tax=Acetobacter nitrogenifigens DSM 23921 = NBRC 105050 TaxID=1120919 RepID=A0A511XFC7_9PROT|nr:hypothetical protein [Acetobacter nitrogenifigens]GBQ96494.1 hypothetical protein AA23498_2651 [Acetobacter nitrogenifigens DSM 23921 = NBRC 105050]GEN61657.1 hypothetical protein ANI02nite_35410 [Acetobacter nitrogenifigens DSM 23921 = NBRC 105050]